MLRITTPRNYSAERRYIATVLFEEFLGIPITIQTEDRTNIAIAHDDEGLLTLPDTLFSIPETAWLTASALPVLPLEEWDISRLPFPVVHVEPRLPVIYGESPEHPDFLLVSENRIHLGLDILGSAFFMLTRYEEAIHQERDALGRFSAHTSLAFQEGFLLRPIINEYLELLWGCLHHLWPRLERKPRDFSIRLTHDVDWPLSDSGSPLRPLRLMKSAASDVFRGDYELAFRRARSLGSLDSDVYNTFDRIMDLSEAHGLSSAFYFIAGHTADRIDGDYSLEHPWIRQLMRTVHARQHEIGLHPSFHTFKDPDQTRAEFQALITVCEREGIEQQRWGGRQHYLRWEASQTWQNWHDAGLDYDSTLTFANHVGYRTGVCYEYPTFNLHTREPLALRERPLIVMDGSLFDYMRLGEAEALELILKLKQQCAQFKGAFVLLWHNNSIVTRREIAFYEAMIPALAQGA